MLCELLHHTHYEFSFARIIKDVGYVYVYYFPHFRRVFPMPLTTKTRYSNDNNNRELLRNTVILIMSSALPVLSRMLGMYAFEGLKFYKKNTVNPPPPQPPNKRALGGNKQFGTVEGLLTFQERFTD